jgi:hypothetical protein
VQEEASDLLERLKRLETQNAHLQAEVHALKSRTSQEQAALKGPEVVDRRGLLKKLGGAAAVGAVGATVLGAQPAAATHQPGFGHQNGTIGNPIAETEVVASSSEPGLDVGNFGDGRGLSGFSDDNVGVFGNSNGRPENPMTIGVWGLSQRTGVFGDGVFFGTGVHGESSSGTGVRGTSTHTLTGGIGVLGESFGPASNPSSLGVVGRSARAGVFGESVSGQGVHGHSNRRTGVRGSGGARGGVFSGQSAQVRLVPSRVRPGSGEAGDLFVDSSRRLWFCHGGTSWTQLAP